MENNNKLNIEQLIALETKRLSDKYRPRKNLRLKIKR